VAAEVVVEELLEVEELVVVVPVELQLVQQELLTLEAVEVELNTQVGQEVQE
tara:strand:+ start:573 stop:728 length:156 start_codon:yes stop_codon:yes gene_type:complete